MQILLFRVSNHDSRMLIIWYPHIGPLPILIVSLNAWSRLLKTMVARFVGILVVTSAFAHGFHGNYAGNAF